MIVFTNGCLDLLTPAHFNLLNYCRHLAGKSGKVIVAIDTDNKITADKGEYRPVYNTQERMKNLLSLIDCNGYRLIDRVDTFSDDDQLYHLIKAISPNIIVKGSDWKGNVVGTDLAEVNYYPRDPRYSTTDIIGRIMTKYQNIDNYRQECLKRMTWESERLGLYGEKP